ncbi:MAG: signal peptidase II [Nanoarchaeota archaeon]
MVKIFFQKIFWLTALATLALDQVLKNLVAWLSPKISLFFLSIHLVRNTGAGFGLLKDHTPWLAIISLLVALAIIYYYSQLPPEKLPQFLWGLFLGGVLGNLIDRILRGYVIDFIDVGFWPAFNVADAAITVAVIGLIVYEWKK